MTAPAIARETFGGLLRDGETPAQAIARLERSKSYMKIIASDEGQRLLEAAQDEPAPAPAKRKAPKDAS